MATRPATRKINLEIDRAAFAAQVRDAAAAAKAEFTRSGVGPAFMAASISASKKQFSELTSEVRKFRQQAAEATGTAEKGFKGVAAKAWEAFKTVGEFGSALAGTVEGAKTLGHLVTHWGSIRRRIDEARKSLKEFVAANKGKLLLGGGALAGGFAGYQGVKMIGREIRQDLRFIGGLYEGVKGKIAGVFGAMKSIAFNPFIPMLIGGGALVGVMALIKDSIQKSADLETFSVSFEVLLGSIDKAQARMKELVTFANTTPFELPEVVAASRELEVLTHGALSTGKGLALVGDLASGTNTKFEETAVTVGRLYDAIRSGRTAGESLMRLQEIGAIGGSARNRIEALITAGRTVEAWKLAESELQRFSGMMVRQSTTWNGLLSTFHDAISEVQRQFSKGIMENDKLSLLGKIDFLGEITPQVAKFGVLLSEKMLDAGNVFTELFANPDEIVGPVTDFLKGGVKEVGNIFLAAMSTGIKVIGGEGFFGALKDGFWGVSKIIAGYFMEAFTHPVAVMKANVEALMDRMPEAMGGTGGAGRQKEELEKANDAWTRMYTATTPEAKARANRERDMHMKNADEANPSVADRIKRITAGGEVGADAKGVIAEGQALIRKSTETLFGNVGDAIKGFKVNDVFGAGGDFEHGRAAIEGMRAKGAAINAQKAADKETQAAAEAHAEAVKRVKHSKFGDTLAGLSSMRETTGLRSSGLKGATMAGSALFPSMLSAAETVKKFRPGAVADMASGVRTASVVTFLERRAIEDSRVATLAGQGIRGQRHSAVAGSFGSIRSGDRQRAREVERERLKEKMNLDKTNNILEKIQARFDEMTR